MEHSHGKINLHEFVPSVRGGEMVMKLRRLKDLTMASCLQCEARRAGLHARHSPDRKQPPLPSVFHSSHSLLPFLLHFWFL
jgi:hypothetical protein